jgi:nucleotide-binding universal stress UspA family protein
MGDLVLGLGRPVLVVPANCAPMKLDLALVGWQDTREARRAVLDALPLLKLANQVVIAEIAAKADRLAAQVHLDDVVAWLQRHGVRAESMVSPLPDDAIERLDDVAKTLGADLIVAGAYGHNRLQEWVFGGVTHDLLQQASCCVLLSH